MRALVAAMTLAMSVCLAFPALAQETSAPAAPGGRPPFADWVADLRAEALERGISAATFDAAFEGVAPQPVVIDRDRTQTEKILSVDEYIERRVTPAVVRRARRELTRHASLLARLEKRYGVPRQILVAIWGLESNFGRFSGVRPTIAALATLAWEGRRAQMFRAQIFDALEILERGEATLAEMRGSWAGAMGQVQFMPSSYLRYAQDVDGDGRRDIWTSLPDVFGSIAFYLKEHGWEPGLPWGYPVRVPRKGNEAFDELQRARGTGCSARRELSAISPAADWRRAGVRPVRAGARRTAPAALLQAGRGAYLVTVNYEALLSYNCAHAYALSVGVLSDRLPR